MARDALAVLSRVRAAGVADAIRDLAAALAVAVAGRVKLEMHRQHIAREQAEATSCDVHYFAAWLPEARRRGEEIHIACRRQDDVVVQLQHALVIRKTEAEAVTKAMQRAKQVADLVAARKEQAVMDEACGRCAGGIVNLAAGRLARPDQAG